MTARLIYARSWLGWPITYWPSGAPSLWSHVGVLVMHEPGSEGAPVVWEARMGRRLQSVALETFAARYDAMQVVEYDVPDADAGLEWLLANRGRPYAMLTVLGQALGLPHGERVHDHCSEVAENYLSACGLRRWRGDLHRVTPNQSYHNICGVVQ